MSKRQFLLYSGAAVVGSVIGGKIGARYLGNYLLENHGQQINLLRGMGNMSPEVVKKVVEIGDYTRSIGLGDMPFDVENKLSLDSNWENPPEFVHGVPERNMSYSLRLEELSRMFFGENTTSIVKGCMYDPGSPFVFNFHTDSQFCGITENAHALGVIHDFNPLILHEVVGHGTDYAKYPKDVLIKVLHGKYKALSHAFEIKGQTDVPWRSIIGALELKVGQFVGKSLSEGGELGVDKKVVDQILIGVSESRGISSEKLKFDKVTCKVLGKVLIQQMLKGNIEFVGELENNYISAMRWAGSEIYAEMVKHAVMSPDRIGHDTVIMEGVGEVIGAIRGEEVDLEVLRRRLLVTTSDVIDRNKAEKRMLEAVNLPNLSQIPREINGERFINSKVLEELRQEEKLRIKRESDFRNFGLEGKVPADLLGSAEELGVFAHYARLYSVIVNRYPSLVSTTNQEYDMKFNPDMNLWRVREIEESVSSRYVRSLLFKGSVAGCMDDLEKKIEIMEKFVNSKAFGS